MKLIDEIVESHVDRLLKAEKEARAKAINECLKILEEEIALAHTIAGKTSRLTSAYMRIKSL